MKYIIYKQNKIIMFKSLYVKKTGKRSSHEYLESPICKGEFIKIISNLNNINLSNEYFLDSFYIRYSSELFPSVISISFDSYSKYFWRTECLGIESASNKDKYWLDRGWSLEETKKIKSSNYGTCSLDFYLSKGYSIEESKSLLKERTLEIKNKANKTKKEISETDPTFSKRGGYGINKWKLLGYSDEDSKLKYEESKSSRFEKIQEFHKENPNFYKSKRTGQVEYWSNKGFTEEESKWKVKESQATFSLDKCIEKYGEIEGPIKFNERQKKWTKSLFANFKKYGDGRSMQSKWASDLIDYICNFLDILRPIKEKWITSIDGTLRCSYDFTYDRKIIEFNGDMWHANPLIHDRNYIIPKCKIIASEKWKIDEEKIRLAESKGYKVLIVWESEYKENKDHIINKCINFLNDK